MKWGENRKIRLAKTTEAISMKFRQCFRFMMWGPTKKWFPKTRPIWVLKEGEDKNEKRCFLVGFF